MGIVLQSISIPGISQTQEIQLPLLKDVCHHTTARLFSSLFFSFLSFFLFVFSLFLFFSFLLVCLFVMGMVWFVLETEYIAQAAFELII